MMKTFEQILQELEIDPQNAVLTKMVNGGSVQMSAEERAKTLNDWASAQFSHQLKEWDNVQGFMAEFTMMEKAQIAISQDPTVAALRLELTTWLSEVHADDPRVVAGLAKLQELGIIDESRKNSMLGIQ